jgi:hypothetical protein
MMPAVCPVLRQNQPFILLLVGRVFTEIRLFPLSPVTFMSLISGDSDIFVCLQFVLKRKSAEMLRFRLWQPNCLYMRRPQANRCHGGPATISVLP